jgi:hypothetical protein
MNMKIEWITCSTLLVEIDGQKRIWDCTDAQTALKLAIALRGTDGTMEAANAVVKGFRK